MNSISIADFTNTYRNKNSRNIEKILNWNYGGIQND